MRVLICGGRDYQDYGTVCDIMAIIPATHIIEGGASGADTLAWKWAKNHLGKGNSTRFDARWDKDGKAAGPIRNQRMIDEGKPDLVVAFPGGKGTMDMVNRARKHGVEVIEVKP